jgi:nitrate reductase alpha subunit
LLARIEFLPFKVLEGFYYEGEKFLIVSDGDLFSAKKVKVQKSSKVDMDLFAGCSATLSSAGVIGEEHNYRETVAPWVRSILLLRPDGTLMQSTPLAFRIHAALAMALFIIWPFTRLVHALSAPVGYLFRPSLIYRTRDNESTSGNRKARPGWERIKY